jgi:hypothetical protein
MHYTLLCEWQQGRDSHKSDDFNQLYRRTSPQWSESTEGANPDILVWAKLSGKKDPVPVSSEKSPALKIYLRKDTGGAIHWQAF